MALVFAYSEKILANVSMLKSIFIFGFLIVINSNAAIGRVGNGGNVIVCQKLPSSICYGGMGVYGVTFYDAYEADIRYKLKPLSMRENAVPPESSVEYALKLLRTVNKYDAYLVKRLSKYILSFESEANFVSGMQLLPIPDTGIAFIPYNSELRQLVVQRDPIALTDSRYVISLDLWGKMSLVDRAHAILHEVLYRYSLEVRPTMQSSEYIRYFNAMIISGEIEKVTQDEYEQLRCSVFTHCNSDSETAAQKLK